MESTVTTGDIVQYVLMGVGGLFTLIALFGSFFTVEHQTAAVVQRLGKFARISGPGLNFKIPFIESVEDRMDLRVLQLNVEVETKTLDNVFVKAVVAVQYNVIEEKVKEAYYKLSKPEAQITSYVFDVVRARVPTLKLDDVFAKKDEIADAVKNELAQVMDDFGYGIVKALVTDIDPDAKVKEAMNEINAAQRHRAAAQEKAEADKILLVKQAEAEAESKKLQGEGIAAQRKAIIDGLRESVTHFKEAVEGTTSQDVMQLMMVTQYFDTLQHVAGASKATTIMLPHSPGGLGDVMQQIRTMLISSAQVPPAEASETTPASSVKPKKADNGAVAT